MAKICSVHHLKSEWKEGANATGKKYAFWGCPTFKETQCKAEQVEDTDEKFVNQVQYPNEQKREKIDEPNWDEIAKGKVRHGVAIAFIDTGVALDDPIKAEMQKWVEWILTGK